MIQRCVLLSLLAACQPNLQGYQRCTEDSDCPATRCLTERGICGLADGGSPSVSDGGTPGDTGISPPSDANDPIRTDAGAPPLIDSGDPSPADGGSAPSESYPSCQALLDQGTEDDGLYPIRFSNQTIQTLCDQEDDGGGWQLMQRAVRDELLWNANSAPYARTSSVQPLPALSEALEGGRWQHHIPFALLTDPIYNDLTFRIVVYQYGDLERQVSQRFFRNLDRTVWNVGVMGPFDGDFYHYSASSDQGFVVCNGAVSRSNVRQGWGVYDTNPESCATYMGGGWLVTMNADGEAVTLTSPDFGEDSSSWDYLEVWVRPSGQQNPGGGVAP